MMKRICFVCPLYLMIVAVAAAQPTTCSLVVEQALAAVGQNCSELSRNMACYGNFAARADFQQEVDVTAFARPADVVELATLNTVEVSPFDADREEWGVVVMNTQADLPATLPGQNVVMLLLGDVQVTDASVERDDRKPMQSFYLSGGIGNTNCQDAPSTVAIRSPENITVNLTINGMDIALGSMITIIDNQNSTLTITVHEGQMVAVATNTVVNAGESVEVTLDPTLTVSAVNVPRLSTPAERDLGNAVDEVFAVIGDTEVAANTYTVQPGDSMFRIALDNGTCVSELARVNNIPDSQVRVISVGRELTIPDGSTCTGLVNDVAAPPGASVPNPPVEVTEPPIIVPTPESVDDPSQNGSENTGSNNDRSDSDTPTSRGTAEVTVSDDTPAGTSDDGRDVSTPEAEDDDDTVGSVQQIPPAYTTK